MRFTLYTFALLFCFACQQENKTTPTVAVQKNYPAALQKVFDAHGGLDKWYSMKTLSYEIEKEGENEKQTIALDDRREKIEASNFVTGYDGANFWLEADSTYKGNAIFYHNLIFYFYAMPFVLADDGIIYTEAEPLNFEGTDYPGFRISYKDGVGVSSKDEYFIHYDPDTYQMAWLGYTVTFKSQKKSERISWARYDDWSSVKGLILPNSMDRLRMEDGKFISKGRRKFVNAQISEEAKPAEFYKQTPNAKVVKK